MSRKSVNMRNQSSEFMDGNGAMSEKVKAMARLIYEEFERMMALFGSEVLECLMPLIVGVLENLDELYKSKQSDDLEMDIIKEDNRTLSTQYDKERSLRKKTEERLFDVEFMYEEEKKSLIEKSQELESMLRISELKLRSSHDLVTRLEDKEKHLKVENQRLQERYTETFKAHGDLLQRLKRYNFSSTSPPVTVNHVIKQSGGASEKIVKKEVQYPKNITREIEEDDDDERFSPHPPRSTGVRINFNEETVAEIFGDDEWISDSISESLFLPMRRPHSSSVDLNNNKQDSKGCNFGTCHTLDDDMGTAENSLEFNNADSDTDLTDDEFGIRKEIESLIKENQDLVDTKNALNVVKDDLINRLDTLTSENEMMREDIQQYVNKQADLIAKNVFLEKEVKRCRKEMKQLEESQSQTILVKTSENGVDQKFFSRTEMAVLLQERNHFKERLLELQDALVYTETMRLKKQFPDQNDGRGKMNQSSVWKFFKSIKKIDESEVPAAVEEKSKVLKTRFRLENNRSQLYSWSIPRALIESSLPKQIPIPIKIQRIFEPKDMVICSTLGFEDCPTDNPATYLWCLTQSVNKQYNLVHISLCPKQPELIQKKYVNLQFPTTPFVMCEVPALIHVTKELSLIRSSGNNDGDNDDVTASINEPSSCDTTKMTKIFHTKVHIKQKSRSALGSKTLWFGCQKNQLLVFVLFDNSKLEGRMATANLPSEIDCITYHIGRVFAMTKSGSICIFDLNKELSQWDLHQCLLMDVSNGLPITTSCCDQNIFLLWLGSSTNCFIVNLAHLSIQKSWVVTEDTPSLDPCTAIESIVQVDKLCLMLLSISRIGSVIGYDTNNFELKMSIDLRPCVFDLIEPVAGLTTLSLYHLVNDGHRLWMATDCGMIFVVTLDCLKSHLSSRRSKISLNCDEVLISSHAFAQCVKNISLLTYSRSSLAIGGDDCPKLVKEAKVGDSKVQIQKGLLMTAIGSCYVNLNNTMADVLNLSNHALIWKI